MNPSWHIITGEYPEQPGGVSDYTRLVAKGLAEAGEDVHVWAPPFTGTTPKDSGVEVHRLPSKFSFGSRRILRRTLDAWPRPCRLLVQYVPHAFGCKAMNLPFARWLRRRSQPVWVMFHEVTFPWERGQSLKHQLLGFVQWRMASSAVRAAEKMFISIPKWKDRLKDITTLDREPIWLPIPSCLPTGVDSTATMNRREKLGVPRQTRLLGHFGTYGGAITDLLTPCLKAILAKNQDCHLFLIGYGSDAYAANLAQFNGRVHAAGALPPLETCECIAACDLLLQPFPDGISCRRSSAMAALALGKPLVSTHGELSEDFWSSSRAVVLAPADRPEELIALTEQLLAEESHLRERGDEAHRLYARYFSLERTIDVLLERQPPLTSIA